MMRFQAAAVNGIVTSCLLNGSRNTGNKMKISVIFTTYNSPEWLKKVLWGYECQDDTNFELVIADDGSTDETAKLIKHFQESSNLTIQHIWHEDNGFKKCQILNKAILAAKGEYMVMTDGDCIPRKDFLSTHRKYAEPGHYLSGGYFKMPMHTSQIINREDIRNGKCFDKKWLLQNGMKNTLKFMKLTANTWQGKLFDYLTPTKRTWNGANSSCFISDAIKVNGFDERMRYGGLDVEFGSRLINAGLKPKQIRHKAICVHLDHARGYANKDDWDNNMRIREETLAKKIIETPAGIKQL